MADSPEMEASKEAQKTDQSLFKGPHTEKENKWISGVVIMNLPP